MEEYLIILKKELYDLDDIEGDVWKYVNDWEKRFWAFIDRDENKAKYDWCQDEFEKIQSLKERKFPKDSFRNQIDCYKKLYIEIEKRE